MTPVTVERKAEIEEALGVVRLYLDSFRDHHDKRVANGQHHILASEERTAAFGLTLCAELLVDAGYVDWELSWRRKGGEDEEE